MKITVDAGHGGYDPGAMGLGIMEKTQNLLMALTLKYVLAEAGHTVYMTRTSDVYPSWANRTYNMPECDVFVALHQDSVGGRSAVYYSIKTIANKSPIFSLRLAKSLMLELEKTEPDIQAYADTSNRHGRLYIEDTNAQAAILWEVDALHSTTSNERLYRAHQFLTGLTRYEKNSV